MTKALALAILGSVMVLPLAAKAEGLAAASPAFVRASACEAAAPIGTEALLGRREVRTSARRKGAPVAVTQDVPAEAEDAPMLRRALHFCAVANAPRLYRT